MEARRYFRHCRKAPETVKRISLGKGTYSSDYTCIYTKKEIIANMIELFNVTTSYLQLATIISEIYTGIMDKACTEWNFVINSKISFKEELTRE